MNLRPLISTLLAVIILTPITFAAQGPQPPAPQQASASTTKPKFISGRDPEYTESAREARIEGTVILTLSVNEKGKVTAVKVQNGLDKGLDQKAVKAAKKWKFEPATENGKPVATDVNVSVDFRLYR
jgi:protein TonB